VSFPSRIILETAGGITKGEDTNPSGMQIQRHKMIMIIAYSNVTYTGC